MPLQPGIPFPASKTDFSRPAQQQQQPSEGQERLEAELLSGQLPATKRERAHEKVMCVVFKVVPSSWTPELFSLLKWPFESFNHPLAEQSFGRACMSLFEVFRRINAGNYVIYGDGKVLRFRLEIPASLKLLVLIKVAGKNNILIPGLEEFFVDNRVEYADSHAIFKFFCLN